MILSEDNYGRHQATQFAVAWMAVGGAGMFVLFDVFGMLRHGPTLQGIVISACVIGLLLWQLHSAMTGLADVRETVGYDHVPVPEARIMLVLAMSVLFGAAAIAIHRSVVLPSLGHAVMLGSLASLLVMATAGILLAGLAAWFVLYPDV